MNKEMSIYTETGLSVYFFFFVLHILLLFCRFWDRPELVTGSGGSSMHLLCKPLLCSSCPAWLAVVCQEYCRSRCPCWRQAEISVIFTRSRQAERTVHAGLSGKQKGKVPLPGAIEFPFPPCHLVSNSATPRHSFSFPSHLYYWCPCWLAQLFGTLCLRNHHLHLLRCPL